MRKIGKPSLLWSSFKLSFLHASWNFERLQNVGFLFSIYNILKKVYRGRNEELLAAVKRHMNFFNTHIFFSPAVAGVIARLEEDIDNADPAAKANEIEGMKMGIMGPMAAIGDSLFWSGLKPFALVIGSGILMLSGYTMESWIYAAVVSLAIYNIPRLIIKNYLLFKSYYQYRELFVRIQKIKFQDIMKSIKMIGMAVLGGIMAGYMGISGTEILPVRFLDNVMFLIVFAIIVVSIRRKISVSNIFISIMVFSIIISYISRG